MNQNVRSRRSERLTFSCISWWYKNRNVNRFRENRKKNSEFPQQKSCSVLLNSEIENNVRTIIFITSQTLIIKHDSSALIKLRKNQEIDKSIQELNENWNKIINDCFEMIVIDEIHSIKSIKAEINKSIEWFQTWMLDMTRTSISNDIQNFQDWVHFLKTKETKNWYNFENFEKMSVTKNVNSFMFKNNHSTSKLIFIEATVKQFILRKRYDSFVQNVNLFKVYFRLLLRRIHVSRILFDSTTIIKSNLFKTKTIMINCKFELNEMTIYKTKKLTFMNEILESDKRKSKQKWLFVIQKKMQMIVFWIFLLKLKN